MTSPQAFAGLAATGRTVRRPERALGLSDHNVPTTGQAAGPAGVADAKTLLETSYAWLDTRMAGREWAVGDSFTLADCAAAPSLFYADWTHAIPERFTTLIAYRKRLLARPSFARAVDEARPFRPFFPLGAPDRD